VALAPAKPLDEILEKEWDSTLFKSKEGLAPMLGWRLCYHTLRSRGSKAGFPDRVLVRDRVIYAELKREKRVATPITPEQREWLDALAKTGGEVYLWRPSDLDEIAQILSKRWQVVPTGTQGAGGLVALGDSPRRVGALWVPDSLWLPGIGRRDQWKPVVPVHPGQLALA
jgi:hypothetical protein